MTTPVLESTTKAEVSSSTSMTMTMPATVNSGDLLLLIAGVRAQSLSTTITGTVSPWTNFANGGSSGVTDIGAWWHEADGTEGSSTCVVGWGGGSANASGVVYRVSGAEDPDTQAPEAATDFLDSDSTTKSPPDLTPTGGAKDYLWFLAFFHRTDGTVSTYPTADNNDTAGATGGVANLSGYCTDNTNTATLTPGDFTTSKTADWSAVTIAVHPPSTGNFTLTADSGTYTYTGTAATVSAGLIMAALSGSYTYTGTAAVLNYGFNLTAESGAYTYSGTNAVFAAAFQLPADSGSYTYTGTAATLERDGTLAADSGTYTYSGTAAALTFASAGNFTLIGESGSYTYSGTNAELDAGLVLDAASGTYTYTGSSADLNRGFDLAADSGSYAYTGTAAALTRALIISADTGTYVYTGTAATLSSNQSGWQIQADNATAWSLQSNNSSTWTVQ